MNAQLTGYIYDSDHERSLLLELNAPGGECGECGDPIEDGDPAYYVSAVRHHHPDYFVCLTCAKKIEASL